MKGYDYLKDADFLKLLDQEHNKFYWVKIEVLDIDEQPVQEIEGRILPGSVISIDGDSAVRRTCNLTFVADEEENDLTNIDSLLAINKKIKIYTGVDNNIDSRYDNIIWFKQGVFVISQPSINHTAGGCTITLSCKDKMSLLNGESGGSFPTSVTFHEYTQIIGDKYLGVLDGTNLIPDAKQDMATWTIEGDSPTITYENDENIITFANSSSGGESGPSASYEAPDGRSYPYYVRDAGDDWYDAHSAIWSNYPIIFCKEFDEYEYFHTALVVSEINGEKQISVPKSIQHENDVTLYSVYPEEPSYEEISSEVQWYSYSWGDYEPAWYIDSILSDCTEEQNPSVPVFDTLEEAYEAYLESSFNGSLYLTIPVEINKTYTFQFDGCSPSGMEESNDNIIITSGYNTIKAHFDRTATETYHTYKTTFTAADDIVIIKFDLSNMFNSVEDVEMKVKNFKLYKNVGADNAIIEAEQNPNSHTVYSFDYFGERYYKMWGRTKGWYDVSSSMIGQMVDIPQLFYDIIQTLVCNFGGEALSRIFINDVPLEIKQLVRYTGSKPLYYNVATGIYTVNADYVVAEGSDNWKVYNFNEDVGYVYTDFVYPGELISNIGENVCTILDKIKTTLGNYEYFYDVEGNFIFQEKKNYLNNSYDPVNAYRLDNNRKVEVPAENGLAIIDKTNYQVDFSSNNERIYEFTEGNGLISSYVNTPVYSNLKNDFHIWGIKDDKSAIHYHFAIKSKPKEFNTYQVVFLMKNGKYTGGLRLAGASDESGDVQDYSPADWRAELYLRGLSKQKLGQRPDIYEQELLDLFDGIYDFKEKKFKADMVYRPNDLNYFFDFLEPTDNLYSCSVDALKTRIYSYKQDKVVKLYTNDVPNQILIGLNMDVITRERIIERCEREGQSYVNVNSEINNHLSIGTIGYSAQEVARNLLYQYTNYNESITIQCIPIFYMEPNRRISVYDKVSGIAGDYVIKSISMPIGGSGLMSITAIKDNTNLESVSHGPGPEPTPPGPEDLISQSNKNLNNWTVSGDGTVTITYDGTDKSNVVEFSNDGSTGGSYLAPNGQTYKYKYKFYAYNTNISSNFYSDYKCCLCKQRTLENPDPNNRYWAYIGTSADLYNLMFDRWRNTATYNHVYGNGGAYTGNGYIETPYRETMNMVGDVSTGNPDYSDLLIFNTYQEALIYINTPELTFTKSYSIDVSTTGINTISFKAKSPTGFNAANNNVQVSYEVSGVATAQNVTLTNTSSNTYESYSVTTDPVDDEVTITFDLSTMVSSSAIELDVKDISMYKQ